MQGLTIHPQIKVELSEQEVHNIFEQRLEQLKGGMWIRDGKVYEENYTSHRFDSEVGDQTHKRFRLLEAIQNLEKVLKEDGWRNG